MFHVVICYHLWNTVIHYIFFSWVMSTGHWAFTWKSLTLSIFFLFFFYLFIYFFFNLFFSFFASSIPWYSTQDIVTAKMLVLTDVLLHVQLFWQKLSFQESLFVRANQVSSTNNFLTHKIFWGMTHSLWKECFVLNFWTVTWKKWSISLDLFGFNTNTQVRFSFEGVYDVQH